MLHSHHASTLSSTKDPKMSKTRFFCLPNTFSIYFKHRIDTAQEASNCAFHKFHHKHKDAARELCFLRWTFLSQRISPFPSVACSWLNVSMNPRERIKATTL